jgi:hypothetical protein
LRLSPASRQGLGGLPRDVSIALRHVVSLVVSLVIGPVVAIAFTSVVVVGIIEAVRPSARRRVDDAKVL